MVNDPGLLLVMEYLPMGSLLDYFRVSLTKPTLSELMKFAQDVAEVNILSPLGIHFVRFGKSVTNFMNVIAGNGVSQCKQYSAQRFGSEKYSCIERKSRQDF